VTLPSNPYNNPAWRSLRQAILIRDLWTCQMCGRLLRPGKTRADSAVVDHVRPAALRPDLFWDEGNLKAICRSCHAICDSIEKRHTCPDAIAEAKAAYRAIGPDGYPVGR